MTHNILSERAMLVTLSISAWSARKLDKRITDQVNRDHNAAPDAGRYNKLLLASNALAQVVTYSGQARTYTLERTLPWLNDGTRILPTAGYDTYTERMRQIREDWQGAVNEFITAYPSLVADAKQRLNGMFNINDYPEAFDIADKFKMKVRFLPIPDAGDFRAAVSDAQADAIRADIEKASQETISAAMADVWQRVATAVGRMSERLHAYKPASGVDDKTTGKFHDSLVENIKDLVELLPVLNITSDPKLDAIAARMQSELCGLDADTLRGVYSARKSVAVAADAILADISQFLA